MQITGFIGITGRRFLKVTVPEHPAVLLTETSTPGEDGQHRWIGAAERPDSTAVLAPTQKQAVELALGIAIPNWRD